jgi:hypothetical protein
MSQEPSGWGASVDGLAVFQGEADLNGGGDFTSRRTFLRAGTRYVLDTGDFVGLSASIGEFHYDFSETATQPWTDIRDIRVSLPMSFGVGGSASVFVSPHVRWDYQSGVDPSDGRTHGIFSGIAWQVSERLTIGPAFGAFTQLEDSGAEVFPALLVDWDIDERWNLATGTGIGATNGPGLTLNYQHTDTLSLALTARSESVRFRLDERGLAPGGVGEDESVPVVVSMAYAPNPAMSFSAFVGAEFDGRLTLEDAAGTEISRQRYDTAPIAGLNFRMRF